MASTRKLDMSKTRKNIKHKNFINFYYAGVFNIVWKHLKVLLY